MSNQILVSKIVPQSMTGAVVEWIYGTDAVSRGCTSLIDLTSLPLADRQDHTKVAEILATEVGAEVFLSLDEDIKLNALPPAI
jgi:hypothetical protein|tara:strand:+ start:801 stop:1049 length:249 start_codon:yes stop_codon:yes gene_type:complete